MEKEIKTLNEVSQIIEDSINQCAPLEEILETLPKFVILGNNSLTHMNADCVSTSITNLSCAMAHLRDAADLLRSAASNYIT